MAKHTPQAVKEEYRREHFVANPDLMACILKAMDWAKANISSRWNVTQEAFEMAVKYHLTPEGPWALDWLVWKIEEELWVKEYGKDFFNTRDDRKACKAGDAAVKAFKEFTK